MADVPVDGGGIHFCPVGKPAWVSLVEDEEDVVFVVEGDGRKRTLTGRVQVRL